MSPSHALYSPLETKGNSCFFLAVAFFGLLCRASLRQFAGSRQRAGQPATAERQRRGTLYPLWWGKMGNLVNIGETLELRKLRFNKIRDPSDIATAHVAVNRSSELNKIAFTLRKVYDTKTATWTHGYMSLLKMACPYSAMKWPALWSGNCILICHLITIWKTC